MDYGEYPKLDAKDRRLLDFIEQYWYTNRGKYPTEKALEYWGVGEGLEEEEIRERLEEKIEPYLQHRGVRSNDNRHLELLEDKQLAAANLVLNFVDRRPTPVKLKALGVTATQWAGWLKDRNFKRYVAERTEDLFEENKFEAKLGLLRAVERGDNGALRLFFEMSGDYKNLQDEQVQNLKIVMARFFEVLQLKVQDRELLASIADEFEAIVNGMNASEKIVDRLDEAVIKRAQRIETAELERFAESEKPVDPATTNLFDL